MLIDDNTMKAFGVKLDWAAERLSSKDNNITILLKTYYCFIITQDSDTKYAPVFVSNKYVIAAAHEALILVLLRHDLKKIR